MLHVQGPKAKPRRVTGRSHEYVALRDLGPNPEGLLAGLEWQVPKGQPAKEHKVQQVSTQVPLAKMATT